MRRFRPHSLTAKFLARLACVLAALAVFFLVSLNAHLNRIMENEARQKAELILAQTGALQNYIRTILRPAMFQVLPEGRFILEAMSTSFATRWIMSDLNPARDAFSYRRVAVEARNPDFEATAEERGYIERLKADPSLRAVEGLSRRPGGPVFVMVRPQRFEPACLRCHGDPAQAPRELIERYGAERGFGRQAGDMAGADIVEVQVESDAEGVRAATLSFALFFAVGALVLFGVIQVFFTRLVAHNLGRVTELMRGRFPDEAEAALPEQGQDEIEDIIRGLEVFADRLGQARVQLREHALTLEERVAERTADLKRVADERRADVTLFVDLLDSLNRSHGKKALLRAALPLLAGRFSASRAAYFCVLSVSDFAVWPPEAQPPDLPPDWTALVSEDVPRLEPGVWYVPVQATEAARGLLCLSFEGERPAEARAAGLAQALGRLMGMAMDSLDALDVLLRQNTLLSSIFEGTGDPLLLLDASGAVLLANTSARRLARSLDPGGGMEQLAAMLTAAPDRGELALPPDRTFSVGLSVLEQADGRGRTVAALRETTTEKRLAAQMSRQEKMAAVGQLAAGLAHEINNPLGVITCYAELLRSALPGEAPRPPDALPPECAAPQDSAPDGQPAHGRGEVPGPDQARADLDVILRHAAQARKVVQDLLDFARPKALSSGPTDLHRTAAAILEVFRPKARKAGTELVLAPAPDLPLVQAGRDALEHILANLVLNALDAAPAQGGRVEISIRATDQGRSVALTVRDNGPGVPADLRGRIFDPFFTTKEVGKGTGLGLPVVYGLARDLCGSVEVAAGQGAAFTVTLPAAPASDENREA